MGRQDDSVGYDRSSDWTCRCCNGSDCSDGYVCTDARIPPLKASLRRADNASPVQAASDPEDNTSVETNPPARSTIPSEVEAENQRLINELRSELLDDRADYIDRWLIAVTIVLAFFGILGFRRFREIEAEARKSVEAAKRYEADAKDHAERIEALQGKAVADVQRIRNLTSEAAADDPPKANLAVEVVRENPQASLIDRAIAHAVSLQQQGKRGDAIEKWHAIALVAKGSDNELAASACFSIGYLRLDPEDCISDYDLAILLKPDFAEAYSNRGAAKHELERHEDAIADYDEAIRLKPDFAAAYSNKGEAKAALGKHRDAIADYDEAIRLNPFFAVAYRNRGGAKGKLGFKDEARKDFETALGLARNTNDASRVAQVEQLLRDLDAGEGS